MRFSINNKLIGQNNSTFIVAELSGNHLQNYDLAVKTIKAMKESGANAVKLQTYTPDSMTIDVNNKYFKINNKSLWDGQTLYQLYKKAYTPWDWQPKLKKIAEQIGLIFFSTPFDKTAVDFLERLKVQAYKISSFEICDIPLIEYVASKHKPIIISTGIASLREIKDAVDACLSMGNKQIALLKCTSAYPAPFEEMNLKTIPDLEKKFKTVIGISDHTRGISVSIAAVSLGAKIVEKHFILDRKRGGPDSAFSMEPNEFKLMVKSVREVEQALGKVNYVLSNKVKRNRIFSRSLFVVKNIKKGDEFTENNIRSIRPGFGISPKLIYEILGKKAKSDISKGTPVKWDFVQNRQ